VKDAATLVASSFGGTFPSGCHCMGCMRLFSGFDPTVGELNPGKVIPIIAALVLLDSIIDSDVELLEGARCQRKEQWCRCQSDRLFV
jgi:hypothetical protein